MVSIFTAYILRYSCDQIALLMILRLMLLKGQWGKWRLSTQVYFGMCEIWLHLFEIISIRCYLFTFCYWIWSTEFVLYSALILVFEGTVQSLISLLWVFTHFFCVYSWFWEFIGSSTWKVYLAVLNITVFMKKESKHWFSDIIKIFQWMMKMFSCTKHFLFILLNVICIG